MATNMTGTVFYPEPCDLCDSGIICETHAEQWPDSWLHPSERKHAPRTIN